MAIHTRVGWLTTTTTLTIIKVMRKCNVCFAFTLQCRHTERDGASNHQRLDCLCNRLFRRRSKGTSKLRVTGLCEGNSPVTGEFPSQRASDVENSQCDDVIMYQNCLIHMSFSIWRNRVFPGIEMYYSCVIFVLSSITTSKPWLWCLRYTSRINNDVQYYRFHYSDVIMSVMASQIAGVSIVYTTTCSGTDHKNQSSVSRAFVRGTTGAR